MIYLCSLYYNKNVKTGANKRFEEILKSLVKKNFPITVIVRKGHVPLDIFGHFKVIEIPNAIIFSRLVDYFLLNFIFIKIAFSHGFLISDFNPISLTQVFSNRQYLLIHDTRLFDGFGRWGKISSFLMKMQLRYCKKFVVVSNFTKASLYNHLNISANNIIVSYNGLPLEKIISVNPVMEVENKCIDILYVATFEERKNHISLIDALSVSDRTLNIVFLGKDLGLKTHISDLSADRCRQHNIKFLDSVSERELESLYTNAKVFISPSLYEGFGMPVLEAYVNGCVVACSDIEVFREILENNALYFDPLDPIDINNAIDKALSIYPHYNPSMKFLEKFSWSQITDNLVKDININC